MLSNEFIKSEMLAESYVNQISAMRGLLQNGKIEECLKLINQLEESMKVTLAIGELYDKAEEQTIN